MKKETLPQEAGPDRWNRKSGGRRSADRPTVHRPSGLAEHLAENPPKAPAGAAERIGQHAA